MLCTSLISFMLKYLLADKAKEVGMIYTYNMTTWRCHFKPI